MREVSSNGIGGFIGLEDPTREPGVAPHVPRGFTDGVQHATGRGAFRAILETVRPSLVHVPSYICRVILEPLCSTATVWRRYPTSPDLSHDGVPEPGDGELLLVVDHFGLQAASIDSLAARHGARLVVDATQALFAEPPARAWSFTSTRKFLGVPDGASARGPRLIAAAIPGDQRAQIAHLELRAAGRLDEARAAFLEHERSLDDRRIAPSAVSDRLLERIDLAQVVDRRRSNFTVLHERLGGLNRLETGVPVSGAPHAYPFLAEHPLEREMLHRRRIFVPTFWPEMPEGTGPDDTSGIEPNAAGLARGLLPLPVDQRYGESEMHAVADAVLELLRR